MKKLNLSMISDNRNTVYGISILWLMLFHATYSFSAPWMLPLERIKDLGSCGADIFLFVSGICLFFSFSKGDSLKDFYRRRFWRVCFPTLLVTVPWFGFLALYRQSGVLMFIQNVTGISLFVSGNRTIWFVVAILCFYSIYPLLYRLFEKTHHAPWSLFLVLCLSFLINFALSRRFPSFWTNGEILFRRLPIFMIGAYCGKFVYEKRTLSLTPVHVIVITGLVTFIYFGVYRYERSFAFQRYAHIIMAPCFAVFFSLLGNVTPIRRVASWFAPITLELYLTHERYLIALQKLMPATAPILIDLLGFCLSLATALLLSCVEKAVLRRVAH